MLEWLMSHVDLNLLWFALVGILFTGYAILDGFDLGVGSLHLLTKTDEHRRLMLNTIGPVWDGNEVWLVTGGGALFAAFPDVYATVFSGFYMPFMLLLAALIFRAVAIEFRSKEPYGWWRHGWDISFSVSSVGAALLIGITLGNIALGVPLNALGEYAGGFWNLLNPYALLVGLTTVALFAMHGSIYVVLKTEGPLQRQAKGWMVHTIAWFIMGYILTTMATLLYVPNLTEHFREHPQFLPVVLLNLLAIANIPREVYNGQEMRAFFSSCASIVLLMLLFGIGMFPNMVYSLPNPQHSLTMYNAASSQQTLATMAIIAAIAVPLVLSYTAIVYWVFRGKVKLDSTSY
ncbi:MAG: cytochrome d ubiquinol oxidase subunit II [Candidatus Melainabacteria bacterium]|nr:cytochrome d ubiquinol oxidase subunit II [Candidatus Melainabacteria bacterium]